MENAVKLSLAGGEDILGRLSQPAEGHTVYINGAPMAPPLGANMKESTRPTLATAIAELVRLRQLAQAAHTAMATWEPMQTAQPHEDAH